MASVLPSCAFSCLAQAIAGSRCETNDQACICGSPVLTSESSICIRADCTVKESFLTQKILAKQCNREPNSDYSYQPILICFLVLATVAVALRIVARFIAGAKLWWDDYANFAALISCIAYTSIVVVMKSRGFGLDIWAVPVENISTILVGSLASSTIYVLARTLVRISILLFLLRIFRTAQARPVIVATLIFMTAEGIAFLPPILFQCAPIQYFWLQWDGVHRGQCIDVRALVWASAIVGIILDFWLILLPLLFVVHLQLPRKTKIFVCSMFAMGGVVIGVSFVRLPTINRFTITENPTFDSVDIAIWSGLENDIGVICACLPSLRVLVKPLISTIKGFGRSQKSSSHGYKSYQNSVPAYNEDFQPTHGGFSTLAPGQADESDIQMTTAIQQTARTHIVDHHTQFYYSRNPDWDDMRMRPLTAQIWA
ncbi:hypothetical protein F5Y15DRAFT_113185 [Xylariaceae sp. FL0016]|nr:hypothetical protein F5Y15DRAFT_113185 [Xylariaceae sp. FL0016]